MGRLLNWKYDSELRCSISVSGADVSVNTYKDAKEGYR